MHLTRLLRACTGLALLGAAPAGDTSAPIAPPPMTGQPMAFVGIGSVNTCAGFLRAVAVERQARTPGSENPEVFHTTLFGALMAWTDGYLTAKNEDVPLNRMAGGDTTLAQRSRWLELFCQANPDSPFYGAVFRLRERLVADGL